MRDGLFAEFYVNGCSPEEGSAASLDVLDLDAFGGVEAVCSSCLGCQALGEPFHGVVGLVVFLGRIQRERPWPWFRCPGRWPGSG